MPDKSIDSAGKPFHPESGYTAFAKVLAKNYISIAELDLRTGNAAVLKSAEDRELEGKELPWPALLERYAKRRAYPEDRAALHPLTSDSLNNFLDQGHSELALEVRCITPDAAYIWVEIKVSVISIPERRLLITARSIDEQRMLKSIVEQFVFQSFDYFILLNAKNNSYTMFSGDKYGTPLPPFSGNDYTAEVARFNAKYLLPEEYEQTTANMQIDHVLKMLEHENRYSFSSSGITADGKPRRSRVQFQYYDKAAGLILLTRTDITGIFLEEQAKNARLTAALFAAQHDALTGLLNQKGIESLVIGSLERLGKVSAAFLFIDVDNFKMVNDTLGHQEGDRLLCFLADSIKKIAGQTGIAGRIGGDEFLLYLPEPPSIGQVTEQARQICHAFDSFIKEFSRELPISCSVGISMYPKDGTDYECLLRKADQALYTSKRYGKNRYYFYSEEMPAMDERGDLYTR